MKLPILFIILIDKIKRKYQAITVSSMEGLLD